MAVTVSKYNSWVEYMAESANLESDVFKLVLLGSGYTYSASHSTYSDVSSDEIANGNGYTTGGLALDSVTSGESSGTLTFDAADEVITASGGAIPDFTQAVIIDDSVSGDPLVMHIDFGETVSLSDGDSATVVWNASGIFTNS